MFIAAAITGMTGACFSSSAKAVEAPAIIGLHLGTFHSRRGLCDVNPGLYAV